MDSFKRKFNYKQHCLKETEAFLALKWSELNFYSKTQHMKEVVESMT